MQRVTTEVLEIEYGVRNNKLGVTVLSSLGRWEHKMSCSKLGCVVYVCYEDL